MNSTGWEAGRPEHDALRADLLRRAQNQKWLPTTFDTKLLEALDGEDPPFVLYFLQIRESVRDSHGWNKVGRAALVFDFERREVLEEKRLPTARKNVKARLSTLNAKHKAGRQAILRLQSDGLERGSISLKSMEGADLAELEVWGLASQFEVVRTACLGNAKGCRGPFIPRRKDQVGCGNAACRQVVSRRKSSPKLQKKSKEQSEKSLREWKDIRSRM